MEKRGWGSRVWVEEEGVGNMEEEEEEEEEEEGGGGGGSK